MEEKIAENRERDEKIFGKGVSQIFFPEETSGTQKTKETVVISVIILCFDPPCRSLKMSE